VPPARILKWLPVGAEYRAEGYVNGFDLIGQVTCSARCLENHPEVQGLPGVDHVEDVRGVECRYPVPDSGEIGGGIPESAVALFWTIKGVRLPSGPRMSSKNTHNAPSLRTAMPRSSRSFATSCRKGYRKTRQPRRRR